MEELTRKELIDKYLKFFENKGHKIIPSASIIPENDPTVLFTTAGMHPLVPYLLGTSHPEGKRVTDVQKCLRTSDIDSVGDDSHLTFFEMLGNWSFGDYFKEEMIPWSYEFLTSKDYLNLPKEKLFFTVFEGNENAPKDEESYVLWKKYGVEEDHIFFLGKECNWWELGSGVGPCGPDTEMFYDTGKSSCSAKCDPSCDCGKYLEIWNDVFMEYNSNNGVYTPLKHKNVDTGMGVERTLTVLNGKKSVYDTSIFYNLKNKLEDITGLKYDDNKKAFRIIMDHIRTSVFILGDNHKLTPSNTGAGYVLRRLIRRMIRYIKGLEVNSSILEELALVVIDDYKEYYNELINNKNFIIDELLKEEEKFNKTLNSGMRMFNKVTKNLNENKLDGENAFKLFDTFGFPLEFTIELANEKNMEVDVKGFEEKFKEHQEKSRTASSGEFKGGLADNTYESVKYHTLAHITLASLKEMYGDDVIQKGCNITPERLRMDFPLDHKMTDEEKETLENKINKVIDEGIDVIREEMSYEDAKNAGADGIFTDKYGSLVSVYTIPGVSKEICGGPHIKNTREIGKVKIVKEESSSAGVRRLKIVME